MLHLWQSRTLAPVGIFDFCGDVSPKVEWGRRRQGASPVRHRITRAAHLQFCASSAGLGVLCTPHPASLHIFQ